MDIFIGNFLAELNSDVLQSKNVIRVREATGIKNQLAYFCDRAEIGSEATVFFVISNNHLVLNIMLMLISNYII